VCPKEVLLTAHLDLAGMSAQAAKWVHSECFDPSYISSSSSMVGNSDHMMQVAVRQNNKLYQAARLTSTEKNDHT